MKLFSTIGSKIDNVFNTIGEHKKAFVQSHKCKTEFQRQEKLIAEALKQAEFQREVEKQLLKLKQTEV